MPGTALDSRFDHDERRFDRRCPGYKAPRVLTAFFFSEKILKTELLLKDK